MELHQLQVTYQAEEDRVLCRASFKAQDAGLAEVRAWLTRRMVRGLWGGMLDAMEKQVALDKPAAAHASGDIVGMEHHATVEAIRDSGSFETAFEEDIAELPLGAAPILVTTINFSLNPGQPIRMNMTPGSGSGFEIAFAPAMLHGFCSLLRDAVKKAEWDLELNLPGSAAPASRVWN